MFLLIKWVATAWLFGLYSLKPHDQWAVTYEECIELSTDRKVCVHFSIHSRYSCTHDMREKLSIRVVLHCNEF